VEEGVRVTDVKTNASMPTRPLVAALLPVLLAVACSRGAEPAPNDAAPRGPLPASASASASASAERERAALECLTVEPPEGSTKAGGVGGGLAFNGAKKLRSGTVSYEPSFTVTTQAADGNNSNVIHDELMTSFNAQYAQTIQSATGADGFRPSDLQPPKSTPQPVAGTRGHAWQIDTIATFGPRERLPWRAFSITTVYRDRVYVVTAAAALPNVGELKPLADRYFASMRFDACK
jgi:hypothetical protein